MMGDSIRGNFRIGHPFPVTVDEISQLERLRKELDDAAAELDLALRQQNIVRLRLALRHCDEVSTQVREFRRSFVSTLLHEVDA